MYHVCIGFRVYCAWGWSSLGFMLQGFKIWGAGFLCLEDELVQGGEEI